MESSDSEWSDCSGDEEEQQCVPDWDILRSTLSPEAFAALVSHAREDQAKSATSGKSWGQTPKDVPFVSGPSEEVVARQLAKERALEDTMKNLRVRSTEEELDIQNAAKPSELKATPLSEAVQQIKEEGVVRLDGVLSPSSCDAMLSVINKQLNQAIEKIPHDEMLPETGFGTVLVRDRRYDMYLNNEGITMKCLNELLHKKDERGIVGKFLTALFGEDRIGDVYFRELSSIVSEPGAPRQPLHPDVHWVDQPPLFTVFVALQDISHAMGPTIFLPGTNKETCHNEFNGDYCRKANFLKSRKYEASLLKKGDCAIFDARTLHCGSGNDKDNGSRRCLFYFTIQNPACMMYDGIDDNLSKHPNVSLDMKSFGFKSEPK
eukprot:g4555.t1